jgi:hypothetical protein
MAWIVFKQDGITLEKKRATFGRRANTANIPDHRFNSKSLH